MDSRLSPTGVSIVICTYNGKKRLERTLIHALGQSVTIPFEIIVVDNASSDGTGDWVREFASRNDPSELIRLVEEYEQGLSSARIRGIRESKYQIILFCDDDNWLSPDYLKIGYLLFSENRSLGVLGGEGIPVFESPKPSWFDQFSHSFAVGDWGMNSGILSQGSAVYGAGCFYRKSAFEGLIKKGWTSILSDRKGNSLSSGGDIELCYAIQLLGFSIGFEKHLKFQHYIEERRLSWEYYLKLKKGISESFPILSSYRFDKFPSLVDFKMHLFHSFLNLIKGLIKTSFLRQNSNQRKVDYVVVRAKFWAFIKNYKSAIDGFKRNQKIFVS